MRKKFIVDFSDLKRAIRKMERTIDAKNYLKEDALDNPEFMEVMQAFRDAPKCTTLEKRKVTVDALEKVKYYIREHRTEIRRI